MKIFQIWKDFLQIFFCIHTLVFASFVKGRMWLNYAPCFSHSGNINCHQCISEFSTHRYCKITYFCWDIILRFCHIVSLQQSKFLVLWKGCNRKPLKYFHIREFNFRDHNTHPHENKTPAKISDFTVYDTDELLLWELKHENLHRLGKNEFRLFF
jgi:hypothetical protein